MPTIRTDYPHAIREIENTWIPLADGTRIAARIWMPADAAANPVPALFEYIPYRKSDYTSLRDAQRYPYFAGHGYAVVRADMRGSGDSDGFLYDEYLLQEQDDALEILAWIAAQPWCNGKTGMTGISWSGFNSLQVAARRPPSLKAIMPIACTDDRYHDDVHYMGGCLLTAQMLPWATVMFTYNPAPPDPRHVGERWREMWLARLEENDPWAAKWLSHQRRDAYWKHGSVGEDYGAINIPVYIVGGWADTYNNTIPRLLAKFQGPRKGLIGPWAHTFPERGEPGPAIGFLQESLRWWDYWLKGIETGIMAEPMMRSWIQESVPPASFYTERPGRWVADPAWPSPYVAEQVWYLNRDERGSWLGNAAASLPTSPLTLRGTQPHGLTSGEWGCYGSPGETALDQQATDGQALSFTSAPLAEAVDILGNPTVTLELAVDQPLALVAVRLCDVTPTGQSRLISWGQLNLTHRDSHEFPTPLEPGRRYSVTVPLNVMGYRVPAGHRLRVAVSPTYGRHAWPSPVPVTLSLFPGAGSQLHLPVRHPQPTDAQLPPFPPAEISPPLPTEDRRTDSRQQTITYNVINGVTTFKIKNDGGRVYLPGNELEWEETSEEMLILHDDDPLATRHRTQMQVEYQRGDWCIRMITDNTLTADATHFHLSHLFDAYEGNIRVFTKTWTFKIPRDLV